jgi:membrane protease YdiL (CAAX protease family)
MSELETSEIEERPGGRPSAADWGPGVALLGTLGALFAGLFLALPIAFIEPDVGSDAAGAAPNIVLQLATVAGFLIVPILVATKGNLDMGWEPLRRRLGITGFGWEDLGWALLAYLAFLSFAATYSQLVGTPDQEDVADLFGPVIFQVLLVVIGAAIAEEVCFRGMLYGGLRNAMGPIPAALLSAGLWGVLHATTGLSAVPVLIGLGIALALLFEKTGSIVPGIIVHAVNNSLALAVLLSD